MQAATATRSTVDPLRQRRRANSWRCNSIPIRRTPCRTAAAAASWAGRAANAPCVITASATRAAIAAARATPSQSPPASIPRPRPAPTHGGRRGGPSFLTSRRPSASSVPRPTITLLVRTHRRCRVPLRPPLTRRRNRIRSQRQQVWRQQHPPCLYMPRSTRSGQQKQKVAPTACQHPYRTTRRTSCPLVAAPLVLVGQSVVRESLETSQRARDRRRPLLENHRCRCCAAPLTRVKDRAALVGSPRGTRHRRTAATLTAVGIAGPGNENRQAGAAAAG